MRLPLIAAILLAAFPARAQYANSNYSPTGAATTDTPTFTWPASPGATSYTLDIEQFGPDQLFTVPASLCSAACSFTPRANLTAGHTAAWWVLPNNGAWSPEFMFYVPILGKGDGWPGNYSDKFDDEPCTKWVQVSDFPGQTR